MKFNFKNDVQYLKVCDKEFKVLDFDGRSIDRYKELPLNIDKYSYVAIDKHSDNNRIVESDSARGWLIFHTVYRVDDTQQRNSGFFNEEIDDAGIYVFATEGFSVIKKITCYGGDRMSVLLSTDGNVTIYFPYLTVNNRVRRCDYFAHYNENSCYTLSPAEANLYGLNMNIDKDYVRISPEA